MKNSLFFIMVVSTLFGGVLEYYGPGERMLSYDPSSIGLGDAYHFGGNLTDVLDNSPSTLWRSPLTRINLITNYSFSKSSFTKQNFSVNHFSFSFPFSSKKVISFGLNPHTRSDYSLKENDGYFIAQNENDFNANPMQVITNYRSYGGISNGYGALSFSINNYFSFGIKYIQMFGTQISDKIILQNEFDTYTNEIIDQDSTQQIIINEYKGNSIQFDSRISYGKSEAVFSATFSNEMKVKSSLYYDVYTYPDIYDRYFLNDFSFVFVESGDQLMQTNSDHEFNQLNQSVKFLDRLRDYSFGYQYLIKSYSGIIFEYHKDNNYNNLNSFNYINQLNIGNYPILESYHLGYFYRFEDIKGRLLSSLIFRTGFYYRYLNFDNQINQDIGIALGVGLGLMDVHTVNLAFKIGKINTDVMGLGNESYFKFTLGLNLGEKWFVKK